MGQITEDELLEKALKGEIVGDTEVANEETTQEPEIQKSPAAQYLGTNLHHKPGESPFVNKDADKKLVEEKHLTRIGEKIGQRAEYRDGWIDVDRELLGDRNLYYPEDWKFKIRPATVDAIRKWSTLDEENPNSIDDIFNEMLKNCLSIESSTGPLPWGNICSWDRFFFILLIRQYTFTQGEQKLKYEETCIECENPVTFELNAESLMYDTPDPEVLKYYDQATRTWTIDPEEFDVNGEPIQLYVPTLEKDANIKAWMIARLQENRNRNIDNSFIRFLTWLAPKISKDNSIASKQIKGYENQFKSWDTDMFTFMDDVLRNIMVTPSSKLTTTCPVCGEEMTSEIRFPNSIRDIFNVSNRFKKFGSK